MKLPDHPNELNAELHWVHLFKDMVFSGEAARMGPLAISVYVTIKAYSSVTGAAFPSVKTIAEKSGMSEISVKRQLAVLEAHGYISKKKAGRHNVYVLREKIHIMTREGEVAHVASWDYIPNGVKDTIAELKNVLITGDLQGAKVVHVENLNLFVNTNNDMVVNQVSAEEHLAAMREILKGRKGS